MTVIRLKRYGSVEGVLVDYQSESCSWWFNCQIHDPVFNLTYTGTFSKSLLAEVKASLGKRVLVTGQRNALEPMTIEIDSIEIFPDESELPTLEEIIGILNQLK